MYITVEKNIVCEWQNQTEWISLEGSAIVRFRPKKLAFYRIKFFSKIKPIIVYIHPKLSRLEINDWFLSYTWKCVWKNYPTLSFRETLYLLKFSRYLKQNLMQQFWIEHIFSVKVPNSYYCTCLRNKPSEGVMPGPVINGCWLHGQK